MASVYPYQREMPTQAFVPNPDPTNIVVPGVDPNLPPNVQIEQVDQLITLRLASIDNNLAKAHQILTTEILPAVQRFAKVSQPTREAARFWRSFFELAAQVRVPQEEADYTTTETEGETEDGDTTETHEPTTDDGNDTVTADEEGSTISIDPTETPKAAPNPFLPRRDEGSEHSFAGVVSSTPARQAGDVSHISAASSSNPEWTPSHGSIVGGSLNPPPFLVDISSASSESFNPPPVPSPKRKGKATKDLRTAVLRRNSKGGPGTPKAKQKLAQFNPFGEMGKWNGIVDLSSSASLSTGTLPDFANLNFSSSESEEPGGSGSRDRLLARAVDSSDSGAELKKPAVSFSDISTSSIRFPPPNPDLVRIVATPGKKAADLLVQDLLAGLDLDDTPGGPEPPAVPSPARINLFATGPRPSILNAMRNPLLKDDEYDNEDEFDDEDDSYVDSGYAAETQPQYTAQQPEFTADMDDSFESDMSFDGGGGAAGGGGAGIGDTTDFGQDDGSRIGGASGEEDTLFGPRGNPPPPQRGFQLEGRSMHTYMHGGRLEDANPMQSSPTPFAGDFAPLDRRNR